MKCPNTSCPPGFDCERDGCIALGGITVSGRMTDADHAEVKPFYDYVASLVPVTPNIAAVVDEMAIPGSDCLGCSSPQDCNFPGCPRAGHHRLALRGVVPNPVVLMFVRGWQGGTDTMIAAELGVTIEDIHSATLQRMGDLMRLAQERRREAENTLGTERGKHEIIHTGKEPTP